MNCEINPSGVLLEGPMSSATPSEEANNQTRLCKWCQSTISIKATICRFCRNSVPMVTLGEENKGYEIEDQEIPTQCGSLKQRFVVIKSVLLKNWVSPHLRNQKYIMDAEPRINVDSLFSAMTALRQQKQNANVNANPDEGLRCFVKLIEWLEEEFKEKEKILAKMKEEGNINYECLWYVFKKGDKILAVEDDLKVGAEVMNTRFSSGFFPSFVISADVIKSNGERLFHQTKSFYIPEFEGVQKITSLPVQPLDDKTLEELKNRGMIFNRIAIGGHYFEYKGKILWHQGYFSTAWKADGRIMIDGISFSRINPTYEEFKPPVINQSPHYYHGGEFITDAGSDTEMKQLPDSQLYKAWPTIGGFSFTVKKWGEIILENIKEIKFDDKAFENLVLPEEKKTLIQALVLYSEESTFTDLITGKGAGCIFLLHGSPGTGKTLTAESVAELLHRPLYSVSVGELGTDPVQLENKLREILEVASVWNAVILIDEADIFLEKRSENEINRNAMVGIFLRLLEYHNGILFLTTNRVRVFDEAFHSRINVALRYEDLNAESRERIWRNLLSASRISNIDASKLSHHNLNGRQIRSSIRLAAALSKSEKKEVNITHLERTIRIGTQFVKNIQNLDKEFE